MPISRQFLFLSGLISCVFLITVYQVYLLRLPTSVQLESDTVSTIRVPILDTRVKSNPKVETELREIDYDFWHKYAKFGGYGVNESCAHYPNPWHVLQHNIYWQTFVNENFIFRLFGAYLDTRETTPAVRVIATANQINKTFPETYCQLWFQDKRQPVIVPVESFLSIWNIEWGTLPNMDYPHLLTCRFPEHLTHAEVCAVRTVSLVTTYCEKARNTLRVNYEVPPPSESKRSEPNFAVCMKGLNFPKQDISQRLIEWFEIQRLLGVEKVYAFLLEVNGHVQQVLDYYSKIGFLELRGITMANGVMSPPNYQNVKSWKIHLNSYLNELIPYNDCLLRNMYKYDYLAAIDIDEIIVPTKPGRTWANIIQQLEKIEKKSCNGTYTTASICFQNVFFPDDDRREDQSPLEFLQRTQRFKKYTPLGSANKCLHNTSNTLTLHNHFSRHKLYGCQFRFIATNVAQLQHYRNVKSKYNKTELIEDRNLWRYSEQLQKSVSLVLRHLNKKLPTIVSN